MKKYYRATLIYSENGASFVDMAEWNVIHETRCFVFCIPEHVSFSEGSYYNHIRLDGETDYQLAKRMNLGLKRVHKEGSRFAFDTKEKAFNRLRFIKSYHVRHLRYQLRMVEQFMTDACGKSYAEYLGLTEHEMEILKK